MLVNVPHYFTELSEKVEEACELHGNDDILEVLRMMIKQLELQELWQK